MRSFDYINPTRIVFGQGMIGKLGKLTPRDGAVMLLYGGGSILRNGVHEQVVSALARHRIVEFGGIRPNPDLAACSRAVAVCREQEIAFVLAVGGGSVIDAAKFIAAASCFEGDDPWRICTSSGRAIKAMLPIGVVLTLPATGSESNRGAVISNHETQEKLAFASPLAFPRFAILDPSVTMSLPGKQVRNGIVDAFVHVCEQYATSYTEARLQDRMAEGILQTLVERGPQTLARPDFFGARADLVWSATLALNTLIGMGVPQDWSTHMIGHELTAFYGLDHAETLAVVLPGVWTDQVEHKRVKLAQLGRRVFGVQGAEATIAAVEGFFRSLDMPTLLREYGIDADEAGDRIATRFAERGTELGEARDITPERVRQIIRGRSG
jgi:NADP-dependent alcohol dehydrogenase